MAPLAPLLLASVVAFNVAWAADSQPGDATPAKAEDQTTTVATPTASTTPAELPPVEVIGYQPLVGNADSASQGQVSGEVIQTRPILRPGEVLEYVPGLVVTQHSGDGKANQYFLRGYNLDHGTDLATFVDDVPVNMTTNAHGQGYMDLNFLIPELIQRMDFQKGPYYAAYGDFSVAGAADIYYYRGLDQDIADLTLGSWRYV